MIEETKVNQIVDRVLKIDEERTWPEEEIMYLTNGGVLKVTPARSMVISMIREAHPEPKPPRVEVEVEGRKRVEENVNDPGYRQALEAYNGELLEATMRSMMYSNVEVLRLPKGVPAYAEDGDWVDELEELYDYKTPTSKRLRYLTWLRYCILGNPKDMTSLREACQRLSGITEEDIKAAEASFQG